PAVRATSSRSSSCERVSRTSVNTGTNASENEPSANRRRRKFGIRNATQNASVIAFAPNTVAITISRTRPNTRDTRVMPLKLSIERSRVGVFMPGDGRWETGDGRRETPTSVEREDELHRCPLSRRERVPRRGGRGSGRSAMLRISPDPHPAFGHLLPEGGGTIRPTEPRFLRWKR